MIMYPDNFHYYANGLDEAFGVAAIVALVWLIAGLLSMALSITMYVLHGLGLYNIAQRRGIYRPWMAWVPVANMWILGSISDQYQYLSTGKIRSRRKLLLGLTIALYGLLVVFWICYAVFMVQTVGSAIDGKLAVAQMLGSAMGMLGVGIVMFVVAIVATVFQYIAYYDLYQSCNPGNATVFLVLSILFNILPPIFVFCCRKKDLGMPPRRNQYAAPVYQSAPQPVYEPAPQPEAKSPEVVEAQDEDFEP